MAVLISSESTFDLSPETVSEYGIRVLPLYVIKGGRSYRDGVEIFPADIFSHVEAGGELCSTSALNIDDYLAFFRELTADGSEVLHISLGSKFSSSLQNARLAAEDFPEVTVFDSENLSAGHGYQVLVAARLAKEGKTVSEITGVLESLRERVECSFLLDDLKYMVKGGRCSAVTAFGANLLGLKPCIEVSDGVMQVCKKYRGVYTKAISTFIKERLSREDIDRSLIFITHASAGEAVVSAAQQAVAEAAPFDEVLTTVAGCTVSCHCGPGTLGIIYARKA